MRPEKKQEVDGWFEKARADLRGADVDLAADPPLVEDALKGARFDGVCVGIPLSG